MSLRWYHGMIFVSLLLISGAGRVSKGQSPCYKIQPEFPINDFDRQHDKDSDSGASFLCTLGITASQAEHAIEQLRAGLVQADNASLRQILQFPVEVGVGSPGGKGTSERWVKVRNVPEWRLFQKSHFTPQHIDWIQNASVKRVLIVNS